MNDEANCRTAVAYFRVSSPRQGHSGLGIEAQRAAVTVYLARTGTTLLSEFVEVESGKRSDRPTLATALACAKRHKATLVVAKLDRLARDVHFLSGLMKAGVDFLACDFPQANRLTLHILAAVAEHETELISARTKAALAAAKARGVKLGSANFPAVQAAGRASIAAAARAQDAFVLPLIVQIWTSGARTFSAIADGLIARDVPSPKGGRWTRSGVRRLINRAISPSGSNPDERHASLKEWFRSRSRRTCR